MNLLREDGPVCGRYYIDLSEAGLLRIVESLEEQGAETSPLKVKTQGEVFPSDLVPAQTGPDRYQPMSWGFKGYGKRLIINARSETALEKPMFSQAMRDHRCLLPASGYYEWENLDGRKQRYAFHLPRGPLFLAGCYRQEKDSPVPSFVILTREAAPGFSHIHARMPVIIPQEGMTDWLTDSWSAMENPVLDLLYEKSSGPHGSRG